MSKDDKNQVAPGSREIPIEGSDDSKPSEAGKVGDSAKSGAVGEPAAEAADDDIVSEAEAVVADAERVAKAESEAAAMRDKYLRLQAEWDNYRKRTAEESAEMRARAAEKLVGDLLPVVDDLERAVAHATENGEAGMLEGVKAISAKLSGVLSKHGLEAIDPAGEAFDALQHQAVATVDDASVPDETVAQVYQKGYRLGKKVLRPAMVTVASGGPKRPADEGDADKK